MSTALERSPKEAIHREIVEAMARERHRLPLDPDGLAAVRDAAYRDPPDVAMQTRRRYARAARAASREFEELPR
jgi:hypothetical protein